jgi:hypothetical protein
MKHFDNEIVLTCKSIAEKFECKKCLKRLEPEFIDHNQTKLRNSIRYSH